MGADIYITSIEEKSFENPHSGSNTIKKLTLKMEDQTTTSYVAISSITSKRLKDNNQRNNDRENRFNFREEITKLTEPQLNETISQNTNESSTEGSLFGSISSWSTSVSEYLVNSFIDSMSKIIYLLDDKSTLSKTLEVRYDNF